MVDKINSPTPPPSRRPETGNTRATQEGSREISSNDNALQGTPANQPEQSVRSTFEQLQANVANSTEIDMGKVSAIKSAIERGDYAIDAQRISRAVVDLEQLLRA